MSWLKKNTSNLVIFAALFAAGGYLLATGESKRSNETCGELGTRKLNVWCALRSEKLTEMDFDREGVQFKLKRASSEPDAGDGRLWRLEQGGKSDLADSFSVDKAMSAIEFAGVQRRIKKEEVDRAAFGLDRPRLRLTLVMGGLRTTLLAGGPAPRPDDSIYIDVDGDVSVVKKEALSTIDVPPDMFRTRTVVPYLSSDLRSMQFSFEGQSYTLDKLAGLTWKLASGELAGTRVDRFVLDRMLGAFADLKADHFLDEPAARKAQQGAPSVTIGMTPADASKPRGEFTVGGPCPDHPDEVVVIRTAPTPLFVCSGKGNLDALRRGSDQLVDGRVFSMREDEIEEVLLEQGDRKLEVVRKGSSWKQRAPVEADVAAEQAKGLLKALAGTRGEGLSRKAPEGFEAVARVTIRGAKESEETRPPEVLELGKPDKDGSVPVKRAHDGAFLTIDRDEARPFLPRTTALRSVKLIDHPIDRIRKIRVHAGGELLQSLERHPEGNWTLHAPKGYSIDIGVAADITESLMRLSADRWVADRDDGSFGLTRPRYKIELDVDGGEDAGAKGYLLELSEPTAAGLYGKLQGVEGVFMVGRQLERTLTSLAIDLGPFMLGPDDVEQLTFRRPGEAELVLVAKKDQLRAPEGKPELPQPKLDAIKASLNDMRAESVVHLGGPRKEEGLDRPALEIQARLTRGGKSARLLFGASDVLRGASIFYARREGIDATFAIPAARVRALLAAL